VLFLLLLPLPLAILSSCLLLEGSRREVPRLLRKSIGEKCYSPAAAKMTIIAPVV